MKFTKYLFFSVAFSAAALLYSCSEGLIDEPVMGPELITIKAHPEGDGTKATFDGTNINWDEGDAISVFAEGSSTSVRFDKRSGDDDSFASAQSVDLKNMYALFPYNSSATMSDGKIITVIKTTQTATAGSFAPDANVAVGFSAGGDEVFFRNAVSYIKLSYRTTATNVAIKKVTLKSLDENVKLTGNVVLTPTVSEGAVSDVTTEVAATGCDYVELSGDLQPGTDYYFVVAPVTLTEGFRIIFTDDKGNEFSKDYAAEKNKAQLVRNSISSTGVKNLDNYEIDVEAYWRVTSADEFTGDGDKYLLVKNTTVSSTGYRIFDEDKTDVYTGSGGWALVDKFYQKGAASAGTFQRLLILSNLKNTLSSWQNHHTPAPEIMSHFVLYCFRNAYTDNGLTLGSYSDELIMNAEDAYSFTVNTGSDGKEMAFKLWYNDNNSNPKHVYKNVVLNNCALEYDDNDHSCMIKGRITRESIDDLIDVMYVNKGDNWNSSVARSNFDGAYQALDVDTIIGYCSQQQTTADGTTMNECFMVKNYYLCNTPAPVNIWLYKRCVKPMAFVKYINL